MHIGGGATSGDAHQGISSGKPALQQILAPPLTGILQAFGAAQQRWGAASQYPLHQLRRAAERGRTFSRIKHAQAARGASAQIKQSPAGQQTRSDGINGGAELSGSSSHRLLGAKVLLAKQLHQLGGAEQIQVCTGWVGLFGQQVTAIHSAAHNNPSNERRNASNSGSSCG